MKFKKTKILLIFLIIFLILFLNFYRKEIKNSFYLISEPIQKSLWRAGDRISDFLEGFSNINRLKKENEELKLKIQELLAENVTLQELKKENQILREALKIGLQKEFKLALAQIIEKEIGPDVIKIDKGFEDGISKEMPVITEQKVLVGKVSEVYTNFSKVKLVTNKEISFDGEIQEKEIIGLVKGKGNLNFYLDLVPREAEIEEGNLIITSALGGIFPKGLLVGKVKKIKKSDIEPMQQAEISPLFSVEEIEKVFIILEW